jgi:acetyl esterase/lipase
VSAVVAAWMPWLFLVAALVGAWFTWNAYRPVYAPAPLAAVSFFAGWLTTELAAHHIAWQLAMTVVFVLAGALARWPGWLALAVTLVSWGYLLKALVVARRAEEVVERALRDGLGADYRRDILPTVGARLAPALDWKQLVAPFPVRHAEVTRQRDVEYARGDGWRLRLDVYHRGDRPAKAPVLLQIHGGAWVVGSKNEQGVPLMVQLASRGWVCVSIDYRLSPRATFPDPLVDCKRALAWIRAHVADYGGDPDVVVVTGGSAGGHLAALVALTANEAEYQPGFEEADTSVCACVSFYGVYDFTDRNRLYRNPGMARLLERRVMKAALDEAREAYEKASPMSQVRPGKVPPFFVVHGDRDTLVPVAEARHFAKLLRDAGPAPVVYAEIPGAQHAFEIFPSLRTTFVLHGVERFLAWVVSRHLATLRDTGDGRTAAG